MIIKITPFNNNHSQLKIDIKIKNNFYGGNPGYCGLITEVKKSDDWLDQEMAWVSRSEIPIISALRLSQIISEKEGNIFQTGNLVSGLIPIIKEHGSIYTTKIVEKFPSKKNCVYLLKDYCNIACSNSYAFQNIGTKDKIIKIFKSFDHKSNLLIRAGTCLYKAYILLNTSFVFAEEIYINTYIAFESLIEYLKIKSRVTRDEVVRKITSIGINNFEEYEMEMRDYKRNDIIHPYRNKYNEEIAQPFLMADDILEDLCLVDWLFKKVLLNEIKK